MTICALCFAFGLGMTLYPMISNLYSEKHKSLVETEYYQAVESMDDKKLLEELGKACAYNLNLQEVTEKPYTKESIAAAGDSYEDILNVRGDGIMGYVEIPAIDVKLPIYHGTTEETLDNGVGHLLGSALPVGGEGSHCVLTGHSGLAGQKMFSDLNQLEAEDVFYLHILDDTCAYRVSEINIVLPEDTSQLAAEEGRDYCTLITCTPYGVNTHRLLVRGERIEYKEAVRATEEAEFSKPEKSTWEQEYLKGIMYGGICLAAIGAVAGGIKLYLSRRKQGKHDAP